MPSVLSKALGSALLLFVGVVALSPMTEAQDLSNESIEILETIEVTATVTVQEERELNIPEPDTTTVVPLNDFLIPSLVPTTVSQGPSRIVRDSIADRKGLRKRARRINFDCLPYPKIARLRSWEGRIVLRLLVNAGGIVEQATIQESSGFPLLDESALKEIKTCRFDPAKDGEFSISSSVDLPITFDLKERSPQ